ncbi:MAG: GDP-mannose 4,6-dehydratase, partial [Fusobacterium sp.]
KEEIFSKSRNDIASSEKIEFNKLDLDWNQYVKTDAKYLRPEELRDLKGDSSKLKELGWTADYTFEAMIDEMIEYWMEIL